MGKGKGEVVGGGVEEEWRRFKETILEVGEEVHGRRKIREGKRRKGSERWNEEIVRRLTSRGRGVQIMPVICESNLYFEIIEWKNPKRV